MDASAWRGGLARFLAGAAASLPWLRREAAAQATLSQAQGAEREVSLLRDQLAALGTMLAEAGERAEKTAAKLLATQDLLAERDAALARAQCEAVELKRTLAGANGELAALRNELRVRDEALPEACARTQENAAESRTTQSVLTECDAALALTQREAGERKEALEGANGELADLRKELGAFKRRREIPSNVAGIHGNPR